MKIPLATDLKTRVGATTKDARLKNSYIEVKGEQSVVRKRPCAQGGVVVGSGTPQGGYGTVLFWGDTATVIDDTTGTTWDSGTGYVIGDHVTVDFVDYWAEADNINSQPPSANWSRDFVAPVVSPTVFAKLNAFDKGFGIILSNGDLTATIPNTTPGRQIVRCNEFKTSGKWYYEITIDQLDEVNYAEGRELLLGLAHDLEDVYVFLGGSIYSWGRYVQPVLISGMGKIHNSIITDYGLSATAGDVFGVAWNMDAGEITFYKNGTSEGVMYSGISGDIYPAIGITEFIGGGFPQELQVTVNFGASAFSHSVPSGYNSGVYA